MMSQGFQDEELMEFFAISRVLRSVLKHYRGFLVVSGRCHWVSGGFSSAVSGGFRTCHGICGGF